MDTPLDTNALWLKAQSLWDFLESQPMLRTGLGLIL